jgi:hypothetical protein
VSRTIVGADRSAKGAAVLGNRTAGMLTVCVLADD